MNAAVRHVVDWVAMLEQLRAADIRTGTISEHTGIAVSTLREYRLCVHSPTHAKGEALIDFWCRVRGEPRDALPMTLALPSARQR